MAESGTPPLRQVPRALRWVSWSRMLLLPDAMTYVGSFGSSGMSSRDLSSSNLNFSVLALPMSLRCFINELYKRGPNTVIAVSWRDCAGFLFVGYWITHCVPCLWVFSGYYFVPHCPVNIWYQMLCYLWYIYIFHSCYFEQVSLDIQQLAHLKLLDENDVFLWIMSLKQMQNQNIFSNLKYPTGFDKVVYSGMFSSYFFQVIFLSANCWISNETCSK